MKFMTLFCLMAMMAMYVNTPLLLSLIVLAASTLAAAQLYWLKSIWMTYGLLLVITGGMMIILLYVSTLSNFNMIQTKTHTPKMLLSLTLIAVMMGMLTMKDQYFSTAESISSLFSPTNSLMVLFITIYLLTSLFMIVKFCESFKGSLTPGT